VSPGVVYCRSHHPESHSAISPAHSLMQRPAARCTR
jgi:hypothetical protein